MASDNEVKALFQRSMELTRSSTKSLELCEKVFPTSNVRVILGFDAPLTDPSTIIGILWDELMMANSREALGGYFDHLLDNEALVAAVKAYAVPVPSEDSFTKQARDDD